MKYEVSQPRSIEVKGRSRWIYLLLLILIIVIIFFYFYKSEIKFFLSADFQVWIFIILTVIAFFFEFFDASFGVGFGTTLSPILLILGFEPVHIITSILFSQFIAGVVAGFSHHLVGNVDFHPGKRHIKVSIIIIINSIIGVFIASLVVVNISQVALKLYIGIIIIMVGVIVLFLSNVQLKFSWIKIILLGLIASFNKGMSGGGYGPVITGGQIISGVETKGAIGITALTEGITCLAGLVIFYILGESINWSLALPLLIGSVLSAPLSAFVVSKVNKTALTRSIGILCFFLGILILFQVYGNGINL